MRLIVAGLLAALSQLGFASVLVDEAKVRAVLRDEKTVIELPISNASGRELGVIATVEWLDHREQVTDSAKRFLRIAAGVSTVSVPLPMRQASIWTRLRYTLEPDREDARVFPRTQAVVSLAHIADYVFTLRAQVPGKPRRGQPVTVHAQAVHPVTGRTLDDGAWEATFTLGEQELRADTMKRLDGGVVLFSFAVPDGVDSADIDIVARRGDFKQDVSLTAEFPTHMSAQVQMDKPIYQPGQTMHFRAVVQEPDGRAAAGAKVVLRVADAGQERVLTRQLTASRFGVVHADYTVPATGVPGHYQLELLADGDEDYRLATHTVRVARYELPSFRVDAKPDKQAYQPGEKISLTVSGMYLFGKPVPRGAVRVVETGGKEEPAAAGVAGVDGVFRAELNLSERFPSQSWQRFIDVPFAAFLTDPISGRTEQRRFDVRLSREAVHIYLSWTDAGGTLPSAAYISTYHADGRPLRSTVELSHGSQKSRVETNQYGLARVMLARQAGDPVSMRAMTADGNTGTWTEVPSTVEGKPHRLVSAKTLHRAGDSVTLELTAPAESAPVQTVVVHALAGTRLLASRAVLLRDRHGSVTFPYQSDFRRAVVFVAAGAEELASRTVIYPDGSDLLVAAVPTRSVYKPGEKAELQMQVSTADRQPVVSALGLAVVDQAVMERVRTDASFGPRPWFRCTFCGDSDQVEMGGVRLTDLYQTKVFSPELDLVAEALAAREGAPVERAQSEDWGRAPIFENMRKQMEFVERELDRHFATTLEFPKDHSALFRAINRTSLFDPWGLSYAAEFGFSIADSTIILRSAGPDKRHGTTDDIQAIVLRKPYFLPLQRMIAEILKRAEDYPATAAEFAELLRENGLLLDGLRDPWGKSLLARVATYSSNRVVTISSAGPDGAFESADDVQLAYFHGSYFQKEASRIAAAVQAAPRAPRTAESFADALKNAGIDVGAYRDAWGRPYHPVAVERSEYRDLRNTRTVQEFGQPPRNTTQLVPVTQKVITFSLRSDGQDGVTGTNDDFTVAPVAVVSANSDNSPAAEVLAMKRDGKGTISGVVIDPSGAAVANATATLIDAQQRQYETKSGDGGNFHFISVPAGMYTVRVEMTGFQRFEIFRVPVSDGWETPLTVVLQVGAVSETVTVSADVPVMQTMSSANAAPQAPMGTLRVRDYFPETLLWLPEVMTDGNGRARVEVPLADSVTTWRVALFASTLDGRWAEAESEILAFQPFFLDFDPPAVLTEGDRVEMPVTLRNYAKTVQTASVRMETGDWAKASGPGSQKLRLSPGESAKLTFPLAATRPREAALTKVTARAGKSADAIQKPLQILPDGQRTVQTVGDFLGGETTLSLTVPLASVRGATRGELRIYPNFAALLLEGAEAILTTPHGCAEQTASAGYANLIAWRFAQATGVRDRNVEARALANIRTAVAGLMAYTGRDGGVRYWGTGEGDVAVTAQALQFLMEARPFAEVDADKLEQMVEWLVAAQNTDGRWRANHGAKDSLILTGLTVRALAAARKAGIAVPDGTLASGYHPITKLTDEFDEPYALAQFVMAALDSGDEKLLGNAVTRLVALAHTERDGLYWDLRANSPFYGWGAVGRLESTSVVVSALAAWRTRHPEDKGLDAAMRGGALFLLRNRDAFGGWYSTQATLRAMKAMADYAAASGLTSGVAPNATVRVNGRLVSVPALHGIDPILVDVSAYLLAGENSVVVSGRAGALLRLTVEHWMPWGQTAVRYSPELKLEVGYERTTASLGELLRCHVKAERVGFRGYGMMLAEVALPPGAEADRASLEDLPVDGYEVLPDKVVFYLWPKAGGVSFTFLVRPRMRVDGKIRASTLFDYYNPDALAEVAPVPWSVQ